MACLPCTRPYYAGEFALKPKISSLLLRILFQFLALFQFKHSLLFCLFSLAAFLFAFLLLCFPLHPFWISFDILYNSFNNRTEFQTEVPLLNISLCRKPSFPWYSAFNTLTSFRSVLETYDCSALPLKKIKVLWPRLTSCSSLLLRLSDFLLPVCKSSPGKNDNFPPM